MISLFVTTGDGEMIETGTIGREGAAGLQRGFGEYKSYGLTTIQIAGDFATIAATRFEQAVSNSAPIRDLAFHYTAALWAEAQQIAACNAAHSGSARLCRRLLQVADCIGSDHIPARSVTVVRRTPIMVARYSCVSALELQELGTIQCKRREITILDRSALEVPSQRALPALQTEGAPRRTRVGENDVRRMEAVGCRILLSGSFPYNSVDIYDSCSLSAFRSSTVTLAMIAALHRRVWSTGSPLSDVPAWRCWRRCAALRLWS
jgi:hypothetical protein